MISEKLKIGLIVFIVLVIFILVGVYIYYTYFYSPVIVPINSAIFPNSTFYLNAYLYNPGDGGNIYQFHASDTQVGSPVLSTIGPGDTFMASGDNVSGFVITKLIQGFADSYWFVNKNSDGSYSLLLSTTQQSVLTIGYLNNDLSPPYSFIFTDPNGVSLVLAAVVTGPTAPQNPSCSALAVGSGCTAVLGLVPASQTEEYPAVNITVVPT